MSKSIDRRKNLPCKRCGSTNTLVMVVLYATMPSRFNRQLTKADLRSKEFRITGQDHNYTSLFCNDCRSSSDD